MLFNVPWIVVESRVPSVHSMDPACASANRADRTSFWRRCTSVLGRTNARLARSCRMCAAATFNRGASLALDFAPRDGSVRARMALPVFGARPKEKAFERGARVMGCEAGRPADPGPGRQLPQLPAIRLLGASCRCSQPEIGTKLGRTLPQDASRHIRPRRGAANRQHEPAGRNARHPHALRQHAAPELL